jgi:hypothetical protein
MLAAALPPPASAAWLLLCAGADPYGPKDRRGANALHWALQGQVTEREEEEEEEVGCGIGERWR